jgi:imidazole glycerol phosphate synthase subunit HisF
LFFYLYEKEKHGIKEKLLPNIYIDRTEDGYDLELIKAISKGISIPIIIFLMVQEILPSL